MDETRNDAATPLGAQGQPQEEPTVDENKATEANIEDTPAATSENHARESRNGDNPGSAGHQSETSGNGHRRSRPNTESCGPRNDPLKKYWRSEIVPLLEQCPDGSIKPPGILNDLLDGHPEDFKGCNWKSLLRSIERHVNLFYAENGTDLPKRSKPCTRTHEGGPGRRLLKFPQEHPPGREAQVDFTSCDKLQVTIQGKPFRHKLFDFRMSHSGWTYVEVALGETLPALMQGLQHAFQELEGVPQVVRTDRLGSAIHKGEPIKAFHAFLQPYELEYTVINTGRPWENGGVEKNNGRIKTNLEQALLIRKSRDFESKDDYVVFIRKVVNWTNRRPEVQEKLANERPGLRPLPSELPPVYVDVERKVTDLGVIELYTSLYSVPCKALDERVKVRAYADHLEVYREDGSLLVRWDRLHRKDGVIIDYHHFFPDILQKAQALAGMREDFKVWMFPRESFKRAYDKLKDWYPKSAVAGLLNADYEYLRILYLAATGDREEAVNRALEQLLKSGCRFGYEDVKQAIPSAPEDKVGFIGQPPL